MKKNITIISDFSKTITACTNPTTWSCIALSGILWNEYIHHREKLFRENYQFEKKWDKKKTTLWFGEHLKIMWEYQLTQKHIQTLVRDDDFFKPREWMELFFEYVKKHWIDLIIITSWITNFVEEFLIYHKISLNNITIIWNELEINMQGKVVWYNQDSIFTPLDNKGIFEKILDINTWNNIYLLGDKKEDLSMYSWKCTCIWFNENVTGYDINFWKKGSLEEVIEEFR